MRWSLVRIVCLKEIREILRDRRSLAIMFGVPLLYPLLAIVLFGVGTGRQKELTEEVFPVVVRNGADAPHLVEEIGQKGTGLKVAEEAPGDPVEALRGGKVQAVIDVPAGYEKGVLAGEKGPELTLTYDRSRTSASFAEQKVGKVLAKYEQWVIDRRLEARGIPPAVVAPLARKVVDVASSQQRLGHLMGTLLPILLLVTGMLGAMFPAFSATTTERELGTLETLLVSPATRLELLVAKGIPVFVSGLLTAGLNLLSMSLVLWRAFSSFEHQLGAMSLSPVAVVLAYLAVVPALIVFSALVLIAGMMARNFREANALATPLMLLPMACIVVTIAEPKPTPSLMITPVVNTALIIKEVLTGREVGIAFALAFTSAVLYAAILLGVAVRLFSNEQLVNPAWEPVSMKLFTRGGGRVRRRRLPTPDEALGIFAVSLLLMFYVQPSLVSLGLIRILTVTELLLVAAPAALAAWLFRYKWGETFSLRPTTVLEVVGGLLVGLGLAVWVGLLSWLQNRVWPGSPETARVMEELFGPALRDHPVLTPIAVGVLAGVCEEFLYRGPVQAGLIRRLPVWFGLTLTALLFAGAHFDLHGVPLRFLLGLILGYVVWRGKTIWPAMVMHGAYDAIQVALAAVVDRWPGVGHFLGVDPTTGAPQWGAATVARLAIGMGILALGWWMLMRAWRGRGEDGAEGAMEPAEPVGPRGGLAAAAGTASGRRLM